MNREELRELVTKKLGSTQLKLSERTINEELDDVLGDFGNDEEANAKLVERVANRLKRMDGNLHADVSKEVKEYKENAEKKQKEDPEHPDPVQGCFHCFFRIIGVFRTGVPDSFRLGSIPVSVCYHPAAKRYRHLPVGPSIALHGYSRY